MNVRKIAWTLVLSAVAAMAAEPAVMWRDPTDLASRNLFYGSGGRKDQPRGVFRFVKEDLNGTNPKFVIRDTNGVKWKVKLGLEARPETVASRIVWAVGYYTNEDYFLRDLQVHGMPAHLKRGQKLVEPGGWVHNVRLKREPEDEKKIGIWHWESGPFAGTRELNGLKAVMAVINNWDLKDVNNAIYQEGNQKIYLVSDIGASFGPAGRAWPRYKAKGNLEEFSRSKLIRRLTPEAVDFQTPARPRFVYLVDPKAYFMRVRLERVGRNVPRADARWIGQYLSRLSLQQLRDAFRAAGYSPDEVRDFANVLATRIASLTDL